MEQVNFEKFIVSFIKATQEYPRTIVSIPACIKKALKDQGLEYKDGEIVKTQDRIAAEAKETGYGEDEKIRKAIIEGLREMKSNFHTISSVKIDDALTWLEKQGQKKCIDDLTQQEAMDIAVAKCFEQKVPVDDFKAKDWYVSKVDGKIHNIYYSVDKVEPTFKVGDWVIGRVTENEPRQIAEITEEGYKTTYDGWIGFSFEEDIHLWTIQDAKDGDILYSPEHNLLWMYKNKEECHVAVNLNYSNTISFGSDIVIPSDAQPATKLQCDYIFSKMHEYGYEWDDKEKVVKEVEFFKSENIWHNYNDPIYVDKTILIVAPNGNSSLALWNGKELLSKTLGGGHNVLCEGDKWAYIEDLIKTQKVV